MGDTLEDFKDADYNPRTIDDESAKALKSSLERFGDISGIVFNRRTGVLVAGHQRKKALLELADGDKIERVVLKDKVNLPDGTVETGYFEVKQKQYHYRVVDWDEETEKAANLIANSQYATGRFEETSLNDMLTELKDYDLYADLRFDRLEPLDLNELPKDEEDTFDKGIDDYTITIKFIDKAQFDTALEDIRSLLEAESYDCNVSVNTSN